MRQAPPSEGPPCPVTDERMRELYARHAAALYRYLLPYAEGERQAAEDLVQETLVRAWRHLDSLNPRVETLRPWLYTVARRLAIDAVRARRARPVPDADIEVETMAEPVDPVDRMLTAYTVRQALSSLSPDHRRVVLEMYFNGRSAREIADLLGVPEGTVRSRAFYALRAMRDVLDRAHGGAA